MRDLKSREDTYLKELLCIDNVSCVNALRRVAERVLGKGLSSLTVDLPEDHPVLDTLKRAGAERVESDEVFMIKYLEPWETPRKLRGCEVIYVSVIDRW